MKLTKYKAKDVFTPTKPARYTFVERGSINNKLLAALKTPGKQIVVYGHSGSGKTTLLVNTLNQHYEHFIITRCISGLTFDQLLLDAFDQLGNFFDAEKVKTNKENISTGLSAEYVGIKAQVGAEISNDAATKKQRILPPQLTPQTLARFLGEAHCCWVLEDFHKIEPDEKKRLAQVMKVFMDMSDRFDNLKIIAIGAVGTARQVVEYDAEMRHRVSEIYVPLMTDEEIKLIPQKGEPLLNILITEPVKDDIVKYSNGLASVCHQLCLNMCFAADVNERAYHLRLFDEKLLKKAIEQYLEEASDTLKSAFDKAFRQLEETNFNDVKLIVEALLKVDQEGVIKTTLYQKIREEEPNYPVKSLDTNLEILQKEERGKIIRYDTVSGRYSFSDPFYRAFALALIEKDRPRDRETMFFISSPFENAMVNLFRERIVSYPSLTYISEPTQQQQNIKSTPKMDWGSPVFTKRKHRKQKR